MAGEPIVTIVANVVADPEPRVSQAGKSWVTFRIVQTPRVRDKQSGEWSDGEPMWIGCRAYGENADNIAATLTKGMRVVVLGRLTQRSYTDQQGQQRTSLDLEVEEIGPSLRFATATVLRGRDRAQNVDFSGQQGGAWGGQPAHAPAAGQSAWGQPAVAQQPPASHPPQQAPAQAAPPAQSPLGGDPWGTQPQQPPAQAAGSWSGQSTQPPAQQGGFGSGFDEEPF